MAHSAQRPRLHTSVYAPLALGLLWEEPGLLEAALPGTPSSPQPAEVKLSLQHSVCRDTLAGPGLSWDLQQGQATAQLPSCLLLPLFPHLAWLAQQPTLSLCHLAKGVQLSRGQLAQGVLTGGQGPAGVPAPE